MLHTDDSSGSSNHLLPLGPGRSNYLHKLEEIYPLPCRHTYSHNIPITHAGLVLPQLPAAYAILWFCFTNNILHQTDKYFSLTCSHNKSHLLNVLSLEKTWMRQKSLLCGRRHFNFLQLLWNAFICVLRHFNLMHLIMTDRSVMGFFAIVIMFQKKKRDKFLPVQTCKHLSALDLQIAVYLSATGWLPDKE